MDRASPPSSQQQPERQQARLECCECAVPVGADGPERAALLLPCQHVLHVSCVEFVKRRVKLLRSLSSDAEALMETLLPTTGADGASTGLFATAAASTFVCPGCQHVVDRIVPLFASGDSPQPSAAARGAREEFGATLKEQRRLLHRLRHLRELRDSVNALGNRCAALHERRASGLREIDRYERAFPSLAHPTAPSTSGNGQNGTTAAYQRMGVAPMTSLEQMSSTELELYLAEVAPLLVTTQSALRKERRAVDKRRAKLAAVKARYYTMKEIAQLDRDIARARRRDQQSSTTTTAAPSPPEQGEPTTHDWERRRRELEQEVAASASASVAAPSGSSPSLSRKRRRATAAVIDVDSEPERPRHVRGGNVARSRTVVVEEDPVDIDNIAVTNGEEGCDVDGGGGEEAVVPARWQRVETVVCSGSDDGDGDGGGAASSPSDDDDEDVVAFQDDGQGSSPTGDEDLVPFDLLPRDGLLPPSLARRARDAASPAASRVRANHVRMLPRMVDRLWQPSLQF